MSISAQRRIRQLLVVGFFAVYAAWAVVVLGLGLVSALASTWSGLHEQLHLWALRTGVVARAAGAVADASHRAEPVGQLIIDYGFSLFNLGLAGFLVWLRPKDRTALLLALAMVGTAAVFNLQAYGIYEALDRTAFEDVVHHTFQLVAAVSYIVALLLFPDGRLVPRWRGWAQAALYVPLLAAVATLAFRVGNTSRTVAVIMYFGLLTPVAAVASQAYRYRRAREPVEQQQARLVFWALLPALLLGLFVLTRQVQSTAFEIYQGRSLEVIPVGLFRIFQPVFALIPVALFVGILRYRLWNIERVISRALLYGILAGFVTAVYVGVVAGLGSLVGSRGGNLWLSILATGVVAVAFQPVKQKVDHLANRLVYGRRATPYEVLSELAGRMSDTVATDEVLSRMARVLAEGTGAARADIWLLVGYETRRAATWPEGAPPTPPPPLVPVAGLERASAKGGTWSVPVRHHGEQLGMLAVTKPPGQWLTPTEEKLLEDVGSQAGLMLRNARLTAELVARLEELRASRQRVLATQDAARRRLERNLHDGAQQQLVALKVMLGLAERLAGNGQPVAELLGQIGEQLTEAVENLRDLARGIYPPLLAAEGLGPALLAQASRVPFALTIDADGIGRYPQEIEAAVYFCCLEAFQNVSKHAGASSVTVTLRREEGGLEFRVTDDGRGFDPSTTLQGSGMQNMLDRIDALDGELVVRSGPGRGTTISGRIPCPEPETAPATAVAPPAAPASAAATEAPSPETQRA
jgi:signal transduction histidine kinase